MANARVLIVNYIEKSLIAELLKRGYEVATANTRKEKHLVPQMSLENFDLVYFAKFSPPL